MHGLSAIEFVFSIIITWAIGLTPPLAIRYAILKRPMGKWPAIGTSALFWFINIVLFTAMGSQSKSHTVLWIIAFVSYWILRRGIKDRVALTGQPFPGESKHSDPAPVSRTSEI